MDAEQRYTEVTDFEIDEDLIYKLEDWGFLQYSIPAEVFYNIEKVDWDGKWCPNCNVWISTKE